MISEKIQQDETDVVTQSEDKMVSQMRWRHFVAQCLVPYARREQKS